MPGALFVLLSLPRGVLIDLQTLWSRTSEVSLFIPSTLQWLFKERERSRIRLCAASSGIYMCMYVCLPVFLISSSSRSQKNHLVIQFCCLCVACIGSTCIALTPWTRAVPLGQSLHLLKLNKMCHSGSNERDELFLRMLWCTDLLALLH